MALFSGDLGSKGDDRCPLLFGAHRYCLFSESDRVIKSAGIGIFPEGGARNTRVLSLYTVVPSLGAYTGLGPPVLHPRRAKQGRLRPQPASLALGYSPLALAFPRDDFLTKALSRSSPFEKFRSSHRYQLAIVRVSRGVVDLLSQETTPLPGSRQAIGSRCHRSIPVPPPQ